jgi:DNA-binding NtrC family response regulator
MTTPLLVVDDDRSIRTSLARQLGKSGYDVTTAGSAEEAMSRLAAVSPALIISDVRMPGMSGIELVRLLRERRPDVDVIVMTAYEDMETALAALHAGAYDFLVKPLDLDLIERVIDRCLRDRALRARARVSADDGVARFPIQHLVGRDPAMLEISKTIAAVAPTQAPVLIRGETGTGKEVIARTIHYHSAAAEEPFVAVNCTAIPETLLESELFGHLRGSFTGASGDRKGRFELAGRGTIFLDEIGDVSPVFQAKLLRVLQEQEFVPVGAERARRTEARVIAATHRPLEQMVRSGAFREDLYFRLRVVEIVVPPLRERRGDIALLAARLLDRVSLSMHKPGALLTEGAMAVLERHDWPGNVRELENALARAVVLARTPALTAEHFALGPGGPIGAPTGSETAPKDDLSLAIMERKHVERVLAQTRGNKRQAARLLKVSRQRLDRILERHGLAANRDPEDRVS